MKKIGITGGIGSGKSTVCKVFELLGIPVFYSDDESKKILAADPAVRKELLAFFGESVMDASGNVDRKKLGALVFNNETSLSTLNSILHPAVGMHFEQWVKTQQAPYILKEAAILFESGAYKQVDKVIVVTAPESVRIARTMKRDKITAEDVQKRMSNQWNDAKKIERADFVIVNDEAQLLIPQVLKLHQELLNK